MSNNVWHYGCFSWFYFGWCYISSASAYNSWIDISLALESFWKHIFYFWYALNLFTQCKSQAIHIWNNLAFISLFVYLPYKKQIALRCLVWLDNWKAISSCFCVTRDEPDVTTRLTIYLYYRDKDIYRQIKINLIYTN